MKFLTVHFQTGYVFPPHEWPSWAKGDMWAPEIHFVGNTFIVYYTARKKSTDSLAVGAAISIVGRYPYGPFKDIGEPLIEDENGALDAHWFRDPR